MTVSDGLATVPDGAVPDPDRAAALDPTTDAATIAAIAARRADLGEFVARHPHAYDALLDWLAAYGDAAARAAVLQRRSPAPPLPSAAAPLDAPAPTLAQMPASAVTPDVAPPAAAPAPTPAPDPRPRNKRKGLLITVVAAGAVLVLAVGGFVWVQVAGLFGGSSSPQAAAEKALRGAIELDPLALATAFAPSEIAALRPAIENIGAIDNGDGTDYLQLAQQLRDAGEITTSGLQFQTEEITEGVTAVTLVSGVITIDGDSAKIAEILAAFSAQTMRSGMAQSGYDDAEIDSSIAQMQSDLETRFAEQLPITYDIEAESARIAEGSSAEAPSPFTVVTVDEGGWYVSPLLSVAELALRQRASIYGQPVSVLRGGSVPAATSYSSPEAAVQGVADGVSSLMEFGDSDDLAAALPLPERRLLSLYGRLYLDPESIRQSAPALQVTSLEVSPTQDGDRASATLDDIAFTLNDRSGGWDASLHVQGTCWQWSRTSYDYEYGDARASGCLSDWSGAEPLGLDAAELHFVRENGGWLVSPLQTLAVAATRASSGVSELVADGRLGELWGQR